MPSCLGNRCKNRGKDVDDVHDVHLLDPGQLSFQDVPHDTSDSYQKDTDVVGDVIETLTYRIEGLKQEKNALKDWLNAPTEKNPTDIASVEEDIIKYEEKISELEEEKKRLDKEDDGDHHNNPNYDKEWSAKYNWAAATAQPKWERGARRVETVDWGSDSDDEDEK
jgi:vacuolar-type H+-ATPase subunit I/STV1